MNIENFRKEVTDIIYEMETDVEITDCEVLKNNGVKLFGLCIKGKNQVVVPTIYLEGYYKEYMSGKDIESIAADIISVNKDAQFKGEFDAEIFQNYSEIKKLLRVKIINTDSNRELLKDVPNREFLDLSIVAYCDVSDMCKTTATILVKKDHINIWDVTEAEVLNTAYDNTKKSGAVISNIFEVLKSNIDCSFNSDTEADMYILSNKEALLGAVALTYDDLLDEFISNLSQEKNGGVYILPSSIHEVILLPEKDVSDPEYLNSIIASVNEESLETEDILSGHAYYYSSHNGYCAI